MKLYEDLYALGAGDDEYLLDILTNMLACASNQDSKATNVDKITQDSGKIDRTYEFYFNLSQVQMKQQLHQLAFRSLL